jgi:UDP-glucose 4-epimerase
MKIFITGVAGFLGSHLANRMIQLGHEVYGNDNLLGGEKNNLNSKINFFESRQLLLNKKCNGKM